MQGKGIIIRYTGLCGIPVCCDAKAAVIIVGNEYGFSVVAAEIDIEIIVVVAHIVRISQQIRNGTEGDEAIHIHKLGKPFLCHISAVHFLNEGDQSLILRSLFVGFQIVCIKLGIIFIFDTDGLGIHKIAVAVSCPAAFVEIALAGRSRITLRKKQRIHGLVDGEHTHVIACPLEAGQVCTGGGNSVLPIGFVSEVFLQVTAVITAVPAQIQLFQGGKGPVFTKIPGILVTFFCFVTVVFFLVKGFLKTELQMDDVMNTGQAVIKIRSGGVALHPYAHFFDQEVVGFPLGRGDADMQITLTVDRGF